MMTENVQVRPPDPWDSEVEFADDVVINMAPKNCPLMVNGKPFPFYLSGDEGISIEHLGEGYAAAVVWLPVLVRHVEVNP